MVTKLSKPSTPVKSSTKPGAKSAGKASAKPDASAAKSVLSSSVKDSAQQIWQAGLGAFTKAQVEGTKAYEALVKEGVSFQRKTQSAAEEKINEATQKMTSMATDISSKASGQWDKLENIFEDRVAKALNKLGVPSAKDIAVLIARIDALNASVQKLSPAKTTTKPSAKPIAKAVAKTAEKPAAKPAPKAAAKKTPARKAAPKAVTPTPAQVNPQ
ncbi:MAG: phasin family protein [Rhodoferax sp.]|nr:phasin family protein [Rhodoferax sp.]